MWRGGAVADITRTICYLRGLGTAVNESGSHGGACTASSNTKSTLVGLSDANT